MTNSVKAAALSLGLDEVFLNAALPSLQNASECWREKKLNESWTRISVTIDHTKGDDPVEYKENFL